MIVNLLYVGLTFALLSAESSKAIAANPYNVADRCMPIYEEYTQATDNPKAFVAAKKRTVRFMA